MTSPAWRQLMLVLMLPMHLAAQGAAADAVERGDVGSTLIEFRVGRLAAQTFTAMARGDTVLLPLRAALRLAEVPFREETPMRWHLGAIATRAETTVELHPAGDSMDRRRHAVLQMRAVVVDGEPYVSATNLSTLLGVDVITSWEELTVSVTDVVDLPIAQRIRRAAARRAAADLDAAELQPPTELPVTPRPFGGLAIDYALQLPLNAVAGTDAAWTLAAGTELLGGGLGVTLTHGSTVADRIDASWWRAWPGASGVAQLRLGDGIGTGPNPRTVRGFAFSNAPLARPDDYGILPFNGSLANGWDIEAWRGGRLVGHDSVDASGHFRLDVPVQYGENAVEFVAYGPDGEIRRFSRNWGVNPDAIAAGKLIYGVSAGGCRTTECDATMNADVRYGVAQGWTARAGVDQFSRATLPNLTHPYATVYGTLPLGVTLALTAVARAVTLAQLSWSPTASFRIGMVAEHFDTNVSNPILTLPGRMNQQTGTMTWNHRGVSLDATLDRFVAAGGATVSARLVASTAAGGLQWLATLASTSGATDVSLARGVLIGVDAVSPSALGRMMLRTGVDFSPISGVERLRMAAGVVLATSLRLDVGATWQPGNGALQPTVMLTGDLPFLRTTTGIASTNANVTQTVQGSLVLDPARGTIVPRGLPAVARAGLAGRACLDLNADGRCTPNEPGVAGLRVSAGGMTTTTGADGRWSLWDLTPYTPATVTIDTASLAAPYLVPPFRTAHITPTANRFVAVDLPIAEGATVGGTVVRTDSGSASGLLLHFRRVGSPDHFVVRTFSDGGFYAIGLHPGIWMVAADSTELQQSGLHADPLQIEILAVRNGGTLDGLRLVLERNHP